jgi:hypothetical protein
MTKKQDCTRKVFIKFLIIYGYFGLILSALFWRKYDGICKDFVKTYERSLLLHLVMDCTHVY